MRKSYICEKLNRFFCAKFGMLCMVCQFLFNLNWVHLSLVNHISVDFYWVNLNWVDFYWVNLNWVYCYWVNFNGVDFQLREQLNESKIHSLTHKQTHKLTNTQQYIALYDYV